MYVIRAQEDVDETAGVTPADGWRLGGIYYNPKDPAVYVRAQVGYGYAPNMAHPWSYGPVLGLLLGVGLLAAFLIWSMR